MTDTPMDNPGHDIGEAQVNEAITPDIAGPPTYGCEACGFADGGCSQCRPRSIFELMADSQAAEDRIQAAADAKVPVDIQDAATDAVASLRAVLDRPGGPAAVSQILTVEEASTRLWAVLPPRLRDWARIEVMRRCGTFMEAGLEASDAALAGIRSVIRDATDGELR